MADEPLLAVVVDVDRWLHRDQQQPFEKRLQRDRDIGRQLTVTDALARVLRWWSQVADSAAPERVGAQVVRVRRLMLLLLLLAGLTVGGFVSSAAMAYDGSYPVNLLLLLAILVVAPGIMLLLTLLALPGWVPGMRSLRESFSALSLGRWALLWIDRVAESQLSVSLRGGRTHSAFVRWQLAIFSQWFAIGFFAGALLIVWLLVAFTDLAFGWSTTLQLNAAELHRFITLLALPWSGWLPAAVPDLPLTEASQYVRLASEGTSRVEAVRLGEWWPFVLMVLVCYGLLPRVMLLAFSNWRARLATRAMLLENPEVTALLDRLNSPSVTYSAVDEDLQEATGETPAATLTIEPDRSLCALTWNDALTTEAARALLRDALQLAPETVLAFSVLETPAQWQRQLESLPAGIASLIIITKGWEPPLLEFVDFVRVLREQLGDAVRMAVVPVDLRGRAVVERDRKVWAGVLARLRDPQLYVMDAFTGVSQ